MLVRFKNVLRSSLPEAHTLRLELKDKPPDPREFQQGNSEVIWGREGKENSCTDKDIVGTAGSQCSGGHVEDACTHLRVEECLALVIHPTTPIPVTSRLLGIELIPCPNSRSVNRLPL